VQPDEGVGCLNRSVEITVLRRAALLLAFLPAAAHAFCGFYVAGGGASLFNDATQVVLMREGTKTVLSMQNNYRGPPENFAMVIPVPIVLQKENVKTLTSSTRSTSSPPRVSSNTGNRTPATNPVATMSGAARSPAPARWR
jgi:hypothetical protein